MGSTLEEMNLQITVNPSLEREEWRRGGKGVNNENTYGEVVFPFTSNGAKDYM